MNHWMDGTAAGYRRDGKRKQGGQLQTHAGELPNQTSRAPSRECGGGEGFEFDSSCSPALSDEGEMREIIQRALHWTRGSEWLRPVSIPV